MQNNHSGLLNDLKEMNMPYSYHESADHAKHWDAKPKDSEEIDYNLLSMHDIPIVLSAEQYDLFVSNYLQ